MKNKRGEFFKQKEEINECNFDKISDVEQEHENNFNNDNELFEHPLE